MKKDRSLEALQTEIDAKFLYEYVASREKDPLISKYYQDLASIESSHVKKMIALHEQSHVPRPSLRARILIQLSKIFGISTLKNYMMQMEQSITQSVVQTKLARGEAVKGDESRHVSILRSLDRLSSHQLLKMEGRHRNVGGNALRAAVLGANDGLVSNLSLVTGVAGAVVDDRAVLIAGIAGMLAGSVSMAMGEWISVKSSQELYQRQIDMELEEIENSPEEEKQELILLYKAKGVGEEQAVQMAEKVMSNPPGPDNPLIAEELNINPEELKGSAATAAIASFLMFLVGAIIPIIPFFFAGGATAFLLTGIFSFIGLFLIGAMITLFTGRSVLLSGLRQIAFGIAAAGITFLAGYLIGQSV